MNSPRIRYDRETPDVLTALAAVNQTIDGHGLDRRLHHLVQLRASQINGCAFCVKMHLREARADGETEERLDRLVVWRHVNDFDAREKAALAWTEALTRLQPDADPGVLRDGLQAHFDPRQIAALTADIAMINLWNRIQVANH